MNGIGERAGNCALAVHRAFYLASSGVDRGEGVADGNAQVIMGVNGDNGFVDIRYALIQAADNVGVLERHGVADGIRNIYGGGASVNRCFHDASQVSYWRTAGVFTGEFDIVSVIARPLHHINRSLNDFIQGAAQFGGDMHRRGGDEGVDTERFGHL
ncbi:hypothetical protein SB00610_03882 [Klebsiella quasipneumoniae subsp. similipneumoniae]|nr:hypothetical protein SB00610_03882 [Klebsiella quasipneumoniae subsp. similipneumoniae]